MVYTIELTVALLAVVAVVAFAAGRLNVPAAILLVIAGVILALIPGLPAVQLAPELVLLVVLPPFIYSSAVAVSWREFHFNLRPIALLAVGAVVFTTLAAAAATHWLLRFPWPIAFVVGAIVSPPDAVAPLSIARRMGLPRRLLVVLEGEGLANDATALVLYRFAVGAVMFGVFSAGEAIGTFGAIVVGEILWGMAVGWTMLRLRRFVGDPRIEITLALLTPYATYWPPEWLGGSGVLATVAAGLYISWNGSKLISAATRLQGIFFWDLYIYWLEGLVFLVTGLQARALADGLHAHSWRELAVSGLVVCGAIILARFVWVFPGVYLPRWLSPTLARRDPPPPWQHPFVLAFTGVRGIVSLAAALAIPFATTSGMPFPERDMILFLTFVVILVTLVGQGLMLPTVIRWLGLANAGAREHTADRVAEFTVRRRAIEASLARLDEIERERGFDGAVLARLRSAYEERLGRVAHRSADNEAHRTAQELHDRIEFELIEAERQRVNELYRGGEISDEARRRIERELDLREAQLVSVRGGE
ncbi:MAG: Na+/H+ antiporter [Gammaproteobacteria bacterium]